jgi:hypothetical protein
MLLLPILCSNETNENEEYVGHETTLKHTLSRGLYEKKWTIAGGN